ncbi:MAG: adenylylsulfate kinase [Patiriisocius sp.]|jgi:adenylylsulfate kinase
MRENIHPIFNAVASKASKEKSLRQKGLTIWFTGLSGSGKSTLAILLEKKLIQDGRVCCLLDGDNIRSGINKDLGFSENDRFENIRRIAEVNRLFNQAGLISISSFISPSIKIRQIAQEIIAKENFIEIFVSTSLEECERRDIKGLYKKARRGEISNFTGVDGLYEPPVNPNYSIDTENANPEESIMNIYSEILKLTAL